MDTAVEPKNLILEVGSYFKYQLNGSPIAREQEGSLE
jgi:hypothetical protein